MPNIEYLDPEIANEGSRADDPIPMEPAHVFDYAAFKVHKVYGKYFKPHSYERFPATFYHKNGETRTVANAEEASALEGVVPIRGGWRCDGDWQDCEASVRKVKPSLDGAGKNLVKASAAQVAGGSNEIMAQILQQLVRGNAPNQALSATMAEDKEYQDYLAFKRMQAAASGTEMAAPVGLSDDEQKAILIGLAKEKGITIDKRWGLDRIKSELDKVGDKAA